MGAYDDIVPYKKQTDEEIVLESKRREAEKAREMFAIRVTLMLPVVAEALEECLRDPDAQTRMRASDIILSRTIPKIAAKHVEEQGEVIDSADVASLRESIVAEIKRRSNGQQ